MSDLVHVDRAVARRILGGDEGAFQELFDRFFPRLYRFVLARVGNDPDAARDIVQQTFCNAIGRLDSYRGEAALYTWFCQICRNVLTDHFRSKGRAESVMLLEDQPNARAILESLAAPVARRAGNRRVAGTRCIASSRRRSIRCRAAMAKCWSGNTSTGCRWWKSPRASTSARKRRNRC